MTIAPPQPAPYGRLELVLARVVFAWAAWTMFPGFTTFTGQPSPVGLAHAVDFTWLAQREPLALGITPLGWVRGALGVSLVVFLTGYLERVTLGVTAACLVAVGTLNNSQGAITHHFQIVGLVAVALWVYALIRPRRGRPYAGDAWLQGERWACFVAQQVVVATYLVTGLTKLKKSGIGWISDAQYFPVQLEKTAKMHYYNTLGDPAAGGDGGESPVVAWLQTAFLESPNLSRIVIGSGLLLELLALLALLGVRWNFAVGTLLVVFHLTVSAAMNLTFKFNIALLLGFFVIPAAVYGLRHVFTTRDRTQA